MLKLVCALVGRKGNAFSVKIDANESVADLKEQIKKKNESDLKAFDADMLNLFLARKGDSWLPHDDPAALQLKEGKVHNDIQTLVNGQKMKATRRIGDVLQANDMTERRALKPGQIHVLSFKVVYGILSDCFPIFG
ncbi:hypothetical protein P43SY_004515 [Pythium insidiosum]|uniref:Crinkler effector protein N-terminal domain-containing protein n=1 Tax=Pythium insidiosum TaxID=114742 RepID=A0AAD5LH53_PYTIN|nr:hypothetical protein P43SY_004515 [Pythium insidiosum]